MKNVTVLESNHNGFHGYKMLDPEGTENVAMSLFCESLVKRSNLALNTVDSYFRSVSNFFDYMYEYINVFIHEEPSENDLILILESWNDYLVFGEKAESEIAVEIYKSLPSPLLSQNSSSLYHAGLKRFLKLSESIRIKLNQLQSIGAVDDSIPQSSNKLFDVLENKKEISIPQKKAMIRNSMLASVLREGPKLISLDFFSLPQSPEKNYEEDDSFPYDKVIDLLDASKSYKDKTLYALLACSGCRISEALQILVEDIDVNLREVILVDPGSRINCSAYMSLSVEDRNKLVFKARKTPHTFLIEPFASLFFKYLELYIENEMPIKSIDEERFLFSITRGDNLGKPAFTGHYSAIFRGFVRAADRVLGKGHGLTPHSLRHTYGEYLANYCPNLNGGYGLPISTIQDLIGHIEIKNTKKYAAKDKKLAKLEIEIANRKILEPGAPKTILEYQEVILKRELEKVTKKIESHQKNIESETELNTLGFEG